MPLHNTLIDFSKQLLAGGPSSVVIKPPLDEGFGGFGPGFDLGDVLEFVGELGKFPFNLGAGGQINVARPPHEHYEGELFDPSDERTWHSVLGGGDGNGGGNGGNGGNGRAPGTVRRGLYIGGSCPGLWHTTPIRTVFDPKTGAARQVGGNRVANRTSLVQDDSGDLQFFAPVEPTGWKFKYKSGPRRKHTHRITHRHKQRATTKRVSAGGHRHQLTRKQLAAGFGGKAHMRAHR